MYGKISGENNPLFLAFTAWFYFNNPDILSSETLKETFQSLGNGVDPNDRNFFADLAQQYEIRLVP